MEDIKNQLNTKNSDDSAVLDTKSENFIMEMFKAGAHFGHHKSKWNPKMKPFIFTVKNGIHIIDLAQTKEKLEIALDYMQSIINANDQILFVGTKRQARNTVKGLAEDLEMPYVSSRWVGGTFTNFKIISKRIAKLDSLEMMINDPASGSKYKKQEILNFKKEAKRIEDKLGGIRNMKKLPKAIFVFDITEDKLVLKEAKIKNIPVVALVDTNANPVGIDYPIPCNDDAIAVIHLIVSLIKNKLKK